MMNPEYPLSLTKQAAALGISRGSVYYLHRPISDRDQTLMQRIERLHLIAICRRTNAAGHAQSGRA